MFGLCRAGRKNANHDGVTQQIDDRLQAFETENQMLIQAVNGVHQARQAEDTAPMPVYTFLEQYDLKGKTVIPFCTAYSGPSSTLKDIVKATPNSDHRDGIRIVTKVQNAQGMESKTAKIDKWLDEIGF